jgi:transcriptional regulator with XRE-family HTH domain
VAGVLACPACRTEVLARRGDPLCPDCLKGSREMPSRPLWLFDSTLLRQALAQVNLPSVPAIVRAACGLSQRDLAAIVGWSPATLSYYERGQRDGMFDIRTALQFADAVGMPRGALLPLVFADADAGQAPGAGDGTDMELSRREFGGLMAGAGLAAASPPASVPRAASMSHIRYWQASTDVLYIRDRAVGGTALLSSALQQWQRVAPAVRGASARESGRQLLAAAGELALCTGWIALDGGRLPLAKPMYEQARELAAGAGDVMLAVHVLTNQSMLYAEMARTGASREPARQALRLAYQAADEGRYIPSPRLHALIALRHASAASLLGDKAAFHAAITQARRELDRGPRDSDPPQWLRFVSETEITGVEARGFLNLADAGRSAMLYRKVLGCELSPRNRASYGAGLADALLKQGARRDAVAAAMDVLPALEGGVTSMRCLNRLRLVRQAAGNTTWAQEFCDRFDAAEQALVGSGGLPRDDAAGTRADVLALHAVAVIPQRRLKRPATSGELSEVRLRSWRQQGRSRFPAWPAALPVTPGLTVVSTVLDVADEGSPRLRPDSEAPPVGILRIAYQAGGSVLGDFDAVVAASAAAGFAPWRGQYGVLCVCHKFSFASVRIIAADWSGSRAWVTRWVQASVNRSTSSADSTYTSPIRPST